MPDVYRARLCALGAIVEVASRLRGGRYHVRRGPIDYPTHDFDAHPYPLEIRTPSFPLTRGAQGRQGRWFFVGSVEIDAVVRIDPGGQVGLADSVLDPLVFDLEDLLERIVQTHNSDGDPIIYRVQNTPAPTCTELVSDDWRLQGVRASFNIEY